MTGPSLDTRLEDPQISAALERDHPDFHKAARSLWAIAFEDESLSPRMRELIVLAIFASPAGYNPQVVEEQTARARKAGASARDIADVFMSVTGIANHALYFALPILEKCFPDAEAQLPVSPETRAEVAAAKEDFVRTRGFWNPDRDILARLMPDYFLVLSQFSVAPTLYGSLSRAERELIYIAIDASVQHMHPQGLELHYRNAAAAGVPLAQILATLKIVSAVGLLGYISAAAQLTETT